MITVILAAGNGRRLGGAKAALLLGDSPIVAHHLRLAEALCCVRTIAVGRPEDCRWLGALGLEAVPSAAPDQAGSLAVAVRALGPVDADEVVLVTPVDAVPVQTSTVEALLGALGPDLDAVTPTHLGRGGHPALVRVRALVPYRAALPPPLREVLRALGPRRARVAVDDPAVTTDLDTPDEVARLTGGPPRFWSP